MSARTVIAADRWASRVIVVAGFVFGGAVGIFVAPQVQSDLSLLGVDDVSFGPALPIILACAIAAAILAHRAGRRRKISNP